MRALLKRNATTAAAASVFFAISTIAWEADQPDDPTAHDAAKLSLLTPGPDQGGQSLLEDIREIEGLDTAVDGQGLALLATVGGLNQAINDLGAKVGEMEISVALSADILFDFDKADIKPTAETELTKLGLIIREKRTGDVTIIGHTDAKGSDNYNMGLSDRRADSVKNWLVKYAQINAEVITTEGLGETQPIAPNVKADGSDDIDGRTKNRRVDVIIQTKEMLN
ncbi:MAG: OmpA family protein [Pseudomonadales bacterium]|jgi:outer membrane protein OmpA-like peptidoglycan-associated protein|tara:strand:+ start:389 stop:1063 length:675 start_codon:yes stop_codon:yes gene_type:complete